jgi:hypothetical protein
MSTLENYLFSNGRTLEPLDLLNDLPCIYRRRGHVCDFQCVEDVHQRRLLEQEVTPLESMLEQMEEYEYISELEAEETPDSDDDSLCELNSVKIKPSRIPSCGVFDFLSDGDSAL